MKESICAVVGMGAGMISWLTGGFDTPVLALLIFMGVDYLTGLIVAGIFHTSPKTAGGGLDSRVGWKGLARKFVTLLILCEQLRVSHLEHFSLTAVSAFFALFRRKKTEIFANLGVI